MDLLYPGFLLLLGSSLVTGRVQPPANVTLHCQNLNNTLRWDYSPNVPGLRYRIDIGVYYNSNADGFQNVIWVEPPAREADLSFLSDPSEAYFLTVTAVLGDKESPPSPSEDGITFSYYKDADVDQRCFVDLPSVDVKAQPHNSICLRFQHPWLQFYQMLLHNQKPKSRKKKSHDEQMSEPLPLFQYEVTIVNQSQNHHTFLCEETVCEQLVPVDPAQQQHCLQIRGDLEQILVQGNHVYCAPSFQQMPKSTHHSRFIYVGVFLCAAVIALVLAMLYRKKTKASTNTPSSIGPIVTEQRQLEPDPVEIAAVRVESPSPSTMPLISETADSTNVFPAVNVEYDVRRRLGVSPENEGVAEEFPAAEPSAAYHSGIGLDEDNAPSGYEKREVLVRLGPDPDDVADGYRC